MVQEFLLKDWGMKAKAVDITIFTPKKYYEEYIINSNGLLLLEYNSTR